MTGQPRDLVNPEGGHRETLEGTERVRLGFCICGDVRPVHLAIPDAGIPGPQTSARQIGAPFPEIAVTPKLGIPSEERFGILKELMRALDLVTLAGREHVMNKMLLLLRGEILGLEPPVAAADVASLSDAMTELEHEACRRAPTPGVFNGHVEAAICALRRAAIGAGAIVYGTELVLPSDPSV